MKCRQKWSYLSACSSHYYILRSVIASFCIGLSPNVLGCVTNYEVCKSKQDKGAGSILENKSNSTTQIQVDLGNLFNEKHTSQQGGLFGLDIRGLFQP